MKKLTLIIIWLIGTMYLGIAQEVLFDIRLHQVNNETNASCYDVQVKMNKDDGIILAGQNYRLYYDGSKVAFNNKTTSFLPQPQYTALVVKQDVQNVDATGYGNIDFISNLSFLNFYIDLEDIKRGGVALNDPTQWFSTCNICFDHKDPSVAQNGFDAIWGSPDKTYFLATAFVEVSMYDAKSQRLKGCKRGNLEDMKKTNSVYTNYQLDLDSDK